MFWNQIVEDIEGKLKDARRRVSDLATKGFVVFLDYGVRVAQSASNVSDRSLRATLASGSPSCIRGIGDRQDPENSDGNSYTHPKDSRITMRACGGYAVSSGTLHEWVSWTMELERQKSGFCNKSIVGSLKKGLVTSFLSSARSSVAMCRQAGKFAMSEEENMIHHLP